MTAVFPRIGGMETARDGLALSGLDEMEQVKAGLVERTIAEHDQWLARIVVPKL